MKNAANSKQTNFFWQSRCSYIVLALVATKISSLKVNDAAFVVYLEIQELLAFFPSFVLKQSHCPLTLFSNECSIVYDRYSSA